MDGVSTNGLHEGKTTILTNTLAHTCTLATFRKPMLACRMSRPPVALGAYTSLTWAALCWPITASRRTPPACSTPVTGPPLPKQAAACSTSLAAPTSHLAHGMQAQG